MLTGFERLSFRQEQHANKNDCGQFVGRYCQGKIELLCLNPVAVPICQSKISQGLDCDRTLVSAVTGRRLTPES